MCTLRKQLRGACDSLPCSQQLYASSTHLDKAVDGQVDAARRVLFLEVALDPHVHNGPPVINGTGELRLYVEGAGATGTHPSTQPWATEARAAFGAYGGSSSSVLPTPLNHGSQPPSLPLFA